MSDNEKRFYWIKLTDTLMFNDLKIKKLRKIAGGDTYTIIYLKLLLLSKNNKGKIEYEGVEDSLDKELAIKLDEEPENISVTLNYLRSVGLLEEIPTTQDIYLPQAETLIGSESQAAERMRKYRERQKQKLLNSSSTNENGLFIEGEMLNDEDEKRNNVTKTVTMLQESYIKYGKRNNVTSMLQPVTNCYTEKEKEKDTLHYTYLYIIECCEKIFKTEDDNLIELLKQCSITLKNEAEINFIRNNSYLLLMIYSINEIYNSLDRTFMNKLDYVLLSNLFKKTETKLEIKINEVKQDEEYDYKRFIDYYIKSIKNQIEGK